MACLDVEKGRSRRKDDGDGACSRGDSNECLRHRVHIVRLIKPGVAMPGMRRAFRKDYEEQGILAEIVRSSRACKHF